MSQLSTVTFDGMLCSLVIPLKTSLRARLLALVWSSNGRVKFALALVLQQAFPLV